MQSSSIPAKFPVPWASGAATTGGPNGDGYRRVPPMASQVGVHDGYASFTDGYPPLCAQPTASGGVPPYIQDTNGALNLITAWDRWVQAGGRIVYDQAFAAAIGGYPLYAEVQANEATAPANKNIVWKSTADNNATDPDGSGAAGWVAKPVVAGSVTALSRPALSAGGIVTLAGFNGAPDIYADSYQGKFRLYTGNYVGLSYDPGSYVLSVMGVPAGQTAPIGQVASVNFVTYPDANGNRVHYFVDGGGNQTGHILQDGTTGNIHVNATGGGAELLVDTAGGLTATALNVDGGEITQVGGIVGTAGSALAVGAGGISTTGPGSVSSQLNLYGRNLTFYAGALGAGNAPTAQMVYNDVTPKTSGPQTEIWCQNACFWVDSAGGGYLRATSSQPSTFGKITTTAVSERALKQDIAPLTGGLAALKAARPKRYRYKPESGEDPSVWRVGWIYEDLLVTMPEATLKVGERGQVDPQWIEPYLHSAVLELEAENASLRARLDALEARIAPAP